MKIAAQVAVVGACLAVPVLYNSPSKLALFASAALASFYLLRPPRAVVDEQELPPQRRGVCMDRYMDSKVPEHLDVIVIGSGMSGLSCASVLARMGKRVLVLEQHDRTGGGTHMYELGPGIKYSFDSGLHYVVPECAKLLQLCTGGEKVPVDFDLMGAPPSPDGSITYDFVYVGNEPVFEVKLWQKHLPELRRRFPDNQADISLWIHEANEAVQSIPVFVISKLLPARWQKFLAPVLLRKWRRQAGRTMKEVSDLQRIDALDSITKNKKLAALLGSLWLDTGSPPHKSSFMLGAAVLWGFPQKGGAYPRGGSQRMSACLVPVVERAGGRVLVRANVENIEIENGKAVGVRLAGGKVVKAPLVVSSAGYNNTFGRLVREKDTEENGIPRRIPVENSCGFVMVNLGLKGSAEDLGLHCANSWFIPAEEGDMFAALDKFWQDPVNEENIPMMISFPSMKDHLQQNATSHTCQVLVMCENDWFRKWIGGKSGNRAKEYEDLKKKWAEAVLYRLYKIYPKIEGRIEFTDVSTPCTIEYYLQSQDGGAVGLDQTPKRFCDWEVQKHLDAATPVKGLWLTGQDILLCGQPLVQLSGIITAFRIAGFISSLRFVASTLFFSVGQ